VNKTQKHQHNHRGHSCMRTNKITKKKECRYGFPKATRKDATVVVKKYSKNKENGDVYYKVDIEVEREDPNLNGYCPFILENFQSNMDWTICSDPLRCVSIFL